MQLHTYVCEGGIPADGVGLGEAKRKRQVLSVEPCPCGSGIAAYLCCFDGRDWHKPVTLLGLTKLPQSTALNKCYMHDLGSCEAPISGEHLISASIMRLLADGGEFTISGLPWIPAGEIKSIGIKALTANCLCKKHNSAISPLDAAALRFFESLKLCFETETGGIRRLVSGHDIERWLLKTLKAMASSGNLSKGQVRLTGAFSSNVEVIDMIDNPQAWPEHTGLYCAMRAGDLTYNFNRLQLAPCMNAADELVGLVANVMGIEFFLSLDPSENLPRMQAMNAVFRPAQIAIDFPGQRNWIAMSWDDDKPHSQTLSLKFLNKLIP